MAGIAHQVRQLFDGALPAKVQGVVQPQAYVDGEVAAPHLGDQTADPAQYPPGLLGLGRIFMAQIQIAEGAMEADFQGMQLGDGLGQGGFSRRAAGQILLKEAPIHPIQPVGQSKLLQYLNIRWKITASQSHALYQVAALRSI